MTNFEKIKKNNGEKFAKTIRNYDNGIFDIPNIVDIVKYAGEEAEPLLPYLISLKKIEIKEEKITDSIDSLLSQAGYDYVIADDLIKQNQIKKYFAKGEELCTFDDKERYKNYHIVNVWKKNIDNIERENFINPSREDEYGTSCMSIQIGRKGGFISIKNRYNHKVNNPDNTYNSNPDNIIEGLGQALKEHFAVDFSSQKVGINGNYHIYKDMILKYNYEINGIFIGEKFYIKNGELYIINNNEEIIIDYFLINLKNKKIENIVNSKDCFSEVLENEIKNKKIIITKNPNYIEKENEFAIIKL
jgi:hypothetical protein